MSGTRSLLVVRSQECNKREEDERWMCFCFGHAHWDTEHRPQVKFSPGRDETAARLVICDHSFRNVLLVLRFAACFLSLGQKHWNGHIAFCAITRGWMACLQGSLEKKIEHDCRNKRWKKSLAEENQTPLCHRPNQVVVHKVHVPASHAATKMKDVFWLNQFDGMAACCRGCRLWCENSLRNKLETQIERWDKDKS